VARRMGSPRRSTFLIATALWAFGNLVPVLYLFAPSGPGVPTGLYVVFFAVEALWFLNILGDIVRARVRPRHR
jgi:Na+-driven multidrug efflux pump